MTSTSPLHPAHGQHLRNFSSGMKLSLPSPHLMANSSPICCMFVGCMLLWLHELLRSISYISYMSYISCMSYLGGGRRAHATMQPCNHVTYVPCVTYTTSSSIRSSSASVL